MWLNDKEETIFGPFMDYVYKHEDDDFKFVLEDGAELIVSLHLYEYESDNGLGAKEKGFEEYWEMAFEIKSVIKDDKNIYQKGDKVLVNYHNVPYSYEAL